MAPIRQFSSSVNAAPPIRNIDSEAPDRMRNELIDLLFHIAENNRGSLGPQRLYNIICQSLGESAAGEPYGGFRRGAAQALLRADWTRVYDLLCRLWPELVRMDADAINAYLEGVNRILAAYGIAWEMDTDGELRRVLPSIAHTQVTAAIAELSAPRFAPALVLLKAAIDAFDARPRRDRDACSNIFDAMESVAKEVFHLPNATFGSVLAHVRQNGGVTIEVVSVLDAINTLRNRKFGHGMTVHFDLTSAEVDFVYLSCIGGILLFAKIP